MSISPEVRASRLMLIPIDYLREGDRFVARGRGRVVMVSGVAAMDGNSVSDRYGFRTNGNSIAGAQYINVRLDDPTKPYGDPYAWNHPNDTLYDEDWTFFVVPTIFARYREDVAYNKNLKAQREAEAKLSDAERAKRDKKVALVAAINNAKRTIAELQSQLETYEEKS